MGIGAMRRGIVCGARSGVEEASGTAGINSGVVMGSAGETVSEGEGFGRRRGPSRGEKAKPTQMTEISPRELPWARLTWE